MRSMAMLVVGAAAAVATLAILAVATLNLLLQPPTLSEALAVLHRSDIIEVTDAFGPESLAFDPQGGGPYTGVADGRVLKWEPSSRSWLTFGFTSPLRHDGCVHPIKPEQEHECGRPLGLKFDDNTGDLYIADAYWGILVIGPSGGLATQLAFQDEGQSFRFTNDLEIDHEDDVIYFTVTSSEFYRREFILSAYSGDISGRLMKYNRSSGEVTVLVGGLANANGVALSRDRSFLVVAETLANRVVRYWLRGPNAGKTSTFVELPGFPDNVRRNSNGEFWVAVAAKRTRLATWILSSRWFGHLLLKLPLDNKQLVGLLLGNRPHATIVKLSEEGQVLEVLEDSVGKKVRTVSQVEERDGMLWFGSVLTPLIGIYKLN